jgi:hypothetical protein
LKKIKVPDFKYVYDTSFSLFCLMQILLSFAIFIYYVTITRSVNYQVVMILCFLFILPALALYEKKKNKDCLETIKILEAAFHTSENRKKEEVIKDLTHGKPVYYAMLVRNKKGEIIPMGTHVLIAENEKQIQNSNIEVLNPISYRE